MSHIDKLKIREVQLNSLSSGRPSLLLETHFQHRRRSTTELQVLSLIHIITCLQKFKIEKQTNQRQNQSQTGLERGKKTNANLISTINLLFFIYTVYLDKNFNLFYKITNFRDDSYFGNTGYLW